MWDRDLGGHRGGMSETTINMSPPPVAPRVFRRSSSDRIIGGVCGGLGRYWNVDPVILRVAFGVSLLVGGFGLFFYLAMWLLVPDETAPPGVRVTESWGLRVLGAVMAFIAAMIGLGLLFSDSVGSGAVVLGALGAGIVVWIVMSQRTPQRPPAEAPLSYGDVTQTALLEQPPVPPREHSYLGLIGLCAAIAATGIALLLGASPTAVLASALLALGVAMLVGALVGRARWLLIFAVPLLVILTAVSQVERSEINIGETVWTPTSAGSTYSLTAGSVTVDFADWQGQPKAGDEITLDVGVGEVQLEAPRNWDIVLVTDLGAGEVTVDGDTRPATSVERLRIPATDLPAEGALQVNVTGKAGSVLIDTDAPRAGTPVPTPTKETKKEKAA